ncbi:MAG: hypothetical protein D6730_09650 [Bacteroidetes bacterium]|nr:MAG: hypothetical protein D6730_09650 [Bacteroidota bacterium]
MQGMRAARATALLSYRSYETYLLSQLEPDEGKLEDFRAISYQQYQGEKLAKRFDAFAYWTLSKAMDTHHVGRNRGGIEAALAKIQAKTLAIALSSDQLFPPHEQEQIARGIAGATFVQIDSIYGHDGFLVEADQLGKIIYDFISENGWPQISRSNELRKQT